MPRRETVPRLPPGYSIVDVIPVYSINIFDKIHTCYRITRAAGQLRLGDTTIECLFFAMTERSYLTSIDVTVKGGVIFSTSLPCIQTYPAQQYISFCIARRNMGVLNVPPNYSNTPKLLKRTSNLTRVIIFRISDGTYFSDASIVLIIRLRDAIA